MKRKMLGIAYVLLSFVPGVAAGQLGTISLLCDNPSSPTQKEAFDINYDRKVINHPGGVSWVQFGDDFIRWKDATYRPRATYLYFYELNRKTGVLLKTNDDTNTGMSFNCRQVERGRMF